MSTGTAVATTERKSVIRDMATRYGMEPDTFENTVRATCMPQGRDVVPMTREEFAAGIMVAENYKLNPILREIYFYPRRGGGIVPVVSIDGWLSLINRRKELDGIEFDELHDEAGNLISVTCRIYRNDRTHPTIVTEYLSECIRDTPPWKMKHRMLRHKAMIQGARYAFGFAGIHDEDEAERIVDAVATPVAPPPPPPPAVSGPVAPPPPAAKPVEPAPPPPPPANTNAGPPVEDAEFTEAPSPAEGGGPEHPPHAQEDPFDAEKWLDEAREHYAAAQSAEAVDHIFAMFEDTATNDLGQLERTKYQDIYDAAVLRVSAQTQPEQPARRYFVHPESDSCWTTDDGTDGSKDGVRDGLVEEVDADQYAAFEAMRAGATSDPAPQSAGQRYAAKIRAAIADEEMSLEDLSALWKDSKPERMDLVAREQLTMADVEELLAEVRAQWTAPEGDAEPEPAIAVYDRDFRAKAEACKTVEEVGALSTNTMAERAQFAGTPEHKAWTALIAKLRKQFAGVA